MKQLLLIFTVLSALLLFLKGYSPVFVLATVGILAIAYIFVARLSQSRRTAYLVNLMAVGFVLMAVINFTRYL